MQPYPTHILISYLAYPRWVAERRVGWGRMGRTLQGIASPQNIAMLRFESISSLHLRLLLTLVTLNKLRCHAEF